MKGKTSIALVLVMIAIAVMVCLALAGTYTEIVNEVEGTSTTRAAYETWVSDVVSAQFTLQATWTWAPDELEWWGGTPTPEQTMTEP